jgi:hypothetical protein
MNQKASTHTLVSHKHNTLKINVNQQSSFHPSQYGENTKCTMPSAPQNTCYNEQKPAEMITTELNRSGGTPLSNNRYSKGIKARLAQLFNSKSTTSSDLLPDYKQTTTTSSSVR